MTVYTCYDCNGRADELHTFKVNIVTGNKTISPSFCPMCGKASTVETVESYLEKHNE